MSRQHGGCEKWSAINFAVKLVRLPNARITEPPPYIYVYTRGECRRCDASLTRKRESRINTREMRLVIYMHVCPILAHIIGLIFLAAKKCAREFRVLLIIMSCRRLPVYITGEKLRRVYRANRARFISRATNDRAGICVWIL